MIIVFIAIMVIIAILVIISLINRPKDRSLKMHHLIQVLIVMLLFMIYCENLKQTGVLNGLDKKAVELSEHMEDLFVKQTASIIKRFDETNQNINKKIDDLSEAIIENNALYDNVSKSIDKAKQDIIGFIDFKTDSILGELKWLKDVQVVLQ